MLPHTDTGNLGKDRNVAITIKCVFDGELSPNETVIWSNADMVIGQCVSGRCIAYTCCWDCLAPELLDKYVGFSSSCSGNFVLIIKQQASSDISRGLHNEKFYISSNSTPRVLVLDLSGDGTELKTTLRGMYNSFPVTSRVLAPDLSSMANDGNYNNSVNATSHAVEFSSHKTSLQSVTERFLPTDREDEDENASNPTEETAEPMYVYNTENHSSSLSTNPYINENLSVFLSLTFTLLCSVLFCLYNIGQKIYRCKKKLPRVHGHIFSAKNGSMRSFQICHLNADTIINVENSDQTYSDLYQVLRGMPRVPPSINQPADDDMTKRGSGRSNNGVNALMTIRETPQNNIFGIPEKYEECASRIFEEKIFCSNGQNPPMNGNEETELQYEEMR